MPSNAKNPARIEGLMLWLDCEVSPVGDRFLAECAKLGVSDQGRDEDEAWRNLQTSLTLFLAECDQHGELEQILSQRGIRFTRMRGDTPPPGTMARGQILAAVRPRRAGRAGVRGTQQTLFFPTTGPGRSLNAI